MDTETSRDVEEFIKTQNTTPQYTTPGRHCAPVEKAMQTYKSYLKSMTASLPSSFPISYWCRLLEQCDLSVNTVCPRRLNPKLSAWTAMEGEFHFESTPLAPPGSQMLMQVKPGNRHTFGLNAKKAWYTGSCLNHYRAFKGVLPSTGGKRISDTVNFQHQAINIHTLTPADSILEERQQLKDAIIQQPKRAQTDELRVIDLLCKVMLGEQRKILPQNNVQTWQHHQCQVTPEESTPTLTVPLSVPISTATPTPATTPVSMQDTDKTLPRLDENYVSVDEDDNYDDTIRPATHKQTVQ
jgi:hypothetical protein